MTTTTPATGPSATRTTPRSGTTTALLAAGVAAGPLFLATTLIQFATKPGVDPRIHPLSMLSLGETGWIQISNFVVAGLLVLASAAGLRRALRDGPAGTWGPILIAAYGATLLLAGAFVTDPGHGYPAGAPDGPPEQLSWHGILHTFAAPLMGLALTGAALVFALRFLRTGRPAWAAASYATAGGYLMLTVTGIMIPDYRLMLAAGALSWLWASAVTAHVLTGRH